MAPYGLVTISPISSPQVGGSSINARVNWELQGISRWGEYVRVKVCDNSNGQVLGSIVQVFPPSSSGAHNGQRDIVFRLPTNVSSITLIAKISIDEFASTICNDSDVFATSSTLYISLATEPLISKYSCRNGTCIKDAYGIFSSLSDCNISCPPTSTQSPKYACVNGTCTQSSSATQTLSECQASCKSVVVPTVGPPVKKYKCTNGNCVEASDGAFSLTECNQICKSGCPSRYKLSPITGKCVLPVVMGLSAEDLAIAGLGGLVSIILIDILVSK